ncbi:MAG TPA: glycosyltransferase [Pirellulales bacterium]|nr:glycosyltransferase [Pirellulales bacterium]
MISSLAELENDRVVTVKRSPVRVLHVINGEDYAGAERVQDTLALRLPDYGYEVGFACLKPRRFAEARRAKAAPLFELPMRGKLDLSPVRRLAGIVRDGNYRLVHTHTPRTALVGLPAARLSGVPLIHHVHCQTAVEVGRRRWQDRLNLVVERLATYPAAKVLAVSASLHRYLLSRGYSPRQLRLTPNGVPVRRSVASAERPPTIGMIALFRPRKGLEVLLRSLSLLRQQGCPVRFRAVGRFQSPEYEKSVKRLAKTEGIDELIEWTGFREDVNAELAEMDALVLPSLVSEAMPMSALEAMAAGVVVIGTRVDGITDLIVDGVDGLLARPGDAVGLAAVIHKAMGGEIDTQPLRLHALRKQRSCYSDASMAAGVADVYEEVLNVGNVGWDPRACERRPTDDWDVANGGPALASSLVPPYGEAQPGETNKT